MSAGTVENGARELFSRRHCIFGAELHPVAREREEQLLAEAGFNAIETFYAG
jgi:hypothetical protein